MDWVLRYVLLSSYGLCVDQVFALTFHESFGTAVEPLTDVELVELHHVHARFPKTEYACLPEPVTYLLNLFKIAPVVVCHN